MSSDQMMMISLEELVSLDHQYRKFKILCDFKAVEEELLAVECGGNYKGYGILRLFKCLLLQFMEDLSERAIERYLADSTVSIQYSINTHSLNLIIKIYLSTFP